LNLELPTAFRHTLRAPLRHPRNNVDGAIDQRARARHSACAKLVTPAID
jgi:hypothetical protein